MAAKNKKDPHINTQRLVSLIAAHGVDKVLEATGYTAGSLMQYTRPSGPVIPQHKLEIAIKLLTK